MLNDPKWKRFAGSNAVFTDKAGKKGAPTVGIGAYLCNNPDCGIPHLTIACIDADGREISVLLAPETGGEIAKTIVEKLGDVGHHYIALKAFRALTMIDELATMSEIECDFLDGHGLRAACRSMLNGDAVVVGKMLPRRYGDEDRLRAIAAVQREQVQGPNTADSLVRVVAEALGLREGGN